MKNTQNFMQLLPGGHCCFCHQDYEEMLCPCGGLAHFTDGRGAGPTICGERCKDSKYKVSTKPCDPPKTCDPFEHHFKYSHIVDVSVCIKCGKVYRGI
ncbi:MAG TPA: hypothetical protein VIH61_09460 [Waddliaceae bacterium]